MTAFPSDSRNAAPYFLVWLVAGSAATYFDYRVPWSAAFGVALYCVQLLIGQSKAGGTQGDDFKDSPYILGYVLTLVSLFVAFRTLPGLDESSLAAVLPRLVRILGAALLTSIVGFVGRQLLIAYDRGVTERAAIFASIEEELRANAASFRRAQVQLVQLVDDFSKDKQRLRDEEIKALNEYLDSIKTVTKSAATIIRRFDGEILPKSSTLGNEISKVAGKAADLAKTLDEQKLQAAGAFPKKEVDSLTSELVQLKAAIANLSAAVTTLKKDYGRLRGVGTEAWKDLQAVDKILSEFIEIAESRINALKIA